MSSRQTYIFLRRVRFYLTVSTKIILKSEECNYWCVQCNRPCCDSCLIDPTHHANHETIRLSETQEKFESRRLIVIGGSVISGEGCSSLELLGQGLDFAKNGALEIISQFVFYIPDERFVTKPVVCGCVVAVQPLIISSILSI